MAQNGKRGFAKMDPEKQRQIASKGGKAAHQQGRAHEFTAEEARVAGRKGGLASHRKSKSRAPAAEETWQEIRSANQDSPLAEYQAAEGAAATVYPVPGDNGTRPI